MFSGALRLMTALAGLVILAAVAAGTWLGYTAFYAKSHLLARQEAELAKRRAQIVQLESQVQAQSRQIERLHTALRLLKTDHRIAYLDVVEQQQPADGEHVQTRIDFVEVDDSGKPLDQPKRFTIEGDLVYIDYWVIKFDDELIEKDDPLRSTSLSLFRRLFGEFQQPNQGFALDRPGTRPQAYGKGTAMSESERKLWDDFWQYATDAQMAAAAGVRAAHGEAPSTKLVPNKRYKILLRASGGLSITPEDRPQPKPAAAA